MRTIVIGDVHGCYKELQQLFKKLTDENAYDRKNDMLVFLGDYIDRGPDSSNVVEFIRNLQKENDRVIALKGNHENMMLDYHDGKNAWWRSNGFETTIASYQNKYGDNEDAMFDDMKWMRTLPLYHEDDHFIYVHAGINPRKKMNEQNAEDLLWIRGEFIHSPYTCNKTVIFGHTPTVSLGVANFQPYSTRTKNICIDTSCVFGGKLTALVIDDDYIERYYQVDSRFSAMDD